MISLDRAGLDGDRRGLRRMRRRRRMMVVVVVDMEGLAGGRSCLLGDWRW